MLYANDQLDDSLTELRGERWNSIRMRPTRSNVDIARILILQERYDEALAVIKRCRRGKAAITSSRSCTAHPGTSTEADAALARLAGGKPRNRWTSSASRKPMCFEA